MRRGTRRPTRSAKRGRRDGCNTPGELDVSTVNEDNYMETCLDEERDKCLENYREGKSIVGLGPWPTRDIQIDGPIVQRFCGDNRMARLEGAAEP